MNLNISSIFADSAILYIIHLQVYNQIISGHSNLQLIKDKFVYKVNKDCY